MYQYSNSLIRQFPSGVTGNAAVGVQATVYVGETNALASLFEVNGSPKSNPVTTDSKGFYSFSVADGDYRIVFSSSQFATLRISVLDGAQIRDDFDDLVASNLAFRNEQQAAYDAFVLSQGWDQVGTFAAGFTFTSPNQVGQDAGGNWWRWNGVLPKTVTAGTLPSSDANYKLVGDGVLRSDLAGGSADVAVPNSGPLNVFYNEHVSVARFGTIDKTGVVNSSAAFRAAQLGAKAIYVPTGTYRVGEVDFQDDQVWYFDNVKLINADNTRYCLRANVKSNFAILGKLEIIGDLGTGGTTSTGETGLLLNACKKYTIENVTARNFRGYGIRRTRTISPSANYGDLGTWSNIKCLVNLIGFDIGELAEYENYTNLTIVENNVGLVVAGGNNNFVNGNVTNNLIGIHLKGGVNNAHGVMSGLNVNHNVNHNWLIENVTQGQTIANCHSYANEPHTSLTGSKIEIKNSKGIHFDGGIYDCKFEIDESGPESGYNYITNIYTPGGYGGLWLRSQLGLKPRTLIVRGCKGYGLINPVDGNNINDPADFYVAAERAAGTTQSLTSAVLTKLLFPSILPNGNNRGAFDPTTSSFAIPTFLRGNFELSLHLVFQGDSITAASSFVQIFYNGSQIMTLTPSSVSNVTSPKQVIFFDAKVDLYLALTGVFEIRANITGTAILFAPVTIGRSQFCLKSLN